MHSVAAAEFTFAAFGDAPYSQDEETHFPDLIAEMNREAPAFVLHVGDFKSAHSACTDETYFERRRWFGLFHPPLVYVPGDNDWLDCRRALADGRDPHERLQKLRSVFFGARASLGQKTLEVSRQSELSAKHHYPEHVRWLHRGVLIVTLNVPGPFNNSRDREEHAQRSAAIADWLLESFSLARERRLHAVIIVMHASPWAPSGHPRRGFKRLLTQLARETRRFGRPVLLVHGDEHHYRVDHPLRDPESGETTENFTRVEVFGSPAMNWVRIRVRGKAGRIRWEITPGS